MNPADWDLPLLGLWALLFVVVLCRAGGTYALGRLARAGAARLSFLDRAFARPGYARAEELIGRYGAPLVAASFFTVGFQTVANLAAGAMRMPLLRYLPALAVGGACWALIFATIGMAGFAAIGVAYERNPVATIVVGAAAVAVLIAVVAVRAARHKDGSSQGSGR